MKSIAVSAAEILCSSNRDTESSGPLCSPWTARTNRRLYPGVVWLGAAAAFMIAAPAAATSITVDLSTTIRPATHAANGSLYGVLETRPDVTTLIAPLHPNMFNNPAAVGSGKQQPVGDAIVVAGRVAPPAPR